MPRENICCAPLLFELLHLVANTKKAGKERERERERERENICFLTQYTLTVSTMSHQDLALSSPDNYPRRSFPKCRLERTKPIKKKKPNRVRM
jgi:hypothetical protein